MNYRKKAEESIKKNVNLWIILWFLLLLNIAMILIFSRGFSWGIVILCCYWWEADVCSLLLKVKIRNRKWYQMN